MKSFFLHFSYYGIFWSPDPVPDFKSKCGACKTPNQSGLTQGSGISEKKNYMKENQKDPFLK